MLKSCSNLKVLIKSYKQNIAKTNTETVKCLATILA